MNELGWYDCLVFIATLTFIFALSSIAGMIERRLWRKNKDEYIKGLKDDLQNRNKRCASHTEIK